MDDPLQLPSLSNFESFFLLKAFGEKRICFAAVHNFLNMISFAPTGKTKASEQAKYLLHRHWAGMLRLGATTFWERFDPQWVSVHDSLADEMKIRAVSVCIH